LYISYSGKSVQEIETEKALSNMLKTDIGIHYMIVYKDLDTLRRFYSHYTKIQIEKNNESVMLNPFYETVDSVREFLYKQLNMNVLEYEKEKVLSIIDSMRLNFGKEEVMRIISRASEYTKYIGKDGITILNDMGCFINNSKYEELLNYELTLPKEYDFPVRGMCLYHQKDFDRLSLEKKQKLIDHHRMTIRIN
jgi:hypothetical protein